MPFFIFIITIIDRHRHYLQLGIDARKDVLILPKELLGKPDRKGQVTLRKTRFFEGNEL